MKTKKVDAKKEVMKGVVDLIRHKIFYGHILQQLTKVYEGHPIPTMGVGKRSDELLIKLYVNEKWIDEMWEKASSDDQAWQWLFLSSQDRYHRLQRHKNLCQGIPDSER